MFWRYATITAAGDKKIAAAGGMPALWTVNVNTAAASAVLTIYDGTSTTGSKVATVDASQIASKGYGISCPNGIYINMSGGNADVTIGYA